MKVLPALLAREFGVPVEMAGDDETLVRQADALADGALQVAREGGDVEAWLRAWVEKEGRPSREATNSP